MGWADQAAEFVKNASKTIVKRANTRKVAVRVMDPFPMEFRFKNKDLALDGARSLTGTTDVQISLPFQAT